MHGHGADDDYRESLIPAHSGLTVQPPRVGHNNIHYLV